MSEKYDFKAVEGKVSKFWLDNNIYSKAVSRNKGKEKYYYLDGPPYTSGKIHIGHAWGKALRDMAMRYKRMQGFDVWDRPGFDMHGLPTENKVWEKFKITKKEQVLEMGLEKFHKECEKFCMGSMKDMIQDFKRLGIWMDWGNPY